MSYLLFIPSLFAVEFAASERHFTYSEGGRERDANQIETVRGISVIILWSHFGRLGESPKENDLTGRKTLSESQ